MKRLCTEEEKQLLYKNRKQMLKGILQTAANSKMAPIFISLFLSIIVMFVVMFAVVEGLGIYMNLSKFQIKLFLLVIFFVNQIVISAIMNVFRVKKEAKQFMKQKNMMINGATIVAVDSINKFSYVEDDVLDEQKRPVIIDYPSCAYDIMPEDIGKRIMVLYSGESEFQLVKLNDELRGMIPESATQDVLSHGLEQCIRVPHPNMLTIDKNGHMISEDEKEEFANWYVKMIQGAAFDIAKICFVVIVICVIIICVGINFAEDGYPLLKTLPIGLGFCVGMAVFFWLMSLLGKVNIKRQAKFTYVKEVVFHSYIMANNTATVKVYEWKEGQMQLCEYLAGNVPMKTPYGSVLYKFTNHKEKEVLMNKERVKKKK